MAKGRELALPDQQKLTAIGLMSGTSMDGIDVAVLTTDGRALGEPGPVHYRPYSEEERELLRAALNAAVTLQDRVSRPGQLAAAESMITAAHAEAVEALLAREPGLNPDLVGFHGQTVLHRPEKNLTVQIGDGAALAKRLGVPVVYDFRAADVEEGGEGAPLVPVFHRALVEAAGLELPLVVLNIGGVANLTWIDAREDGLIAFDTGPGNALMDDFVRRRTGEACDLDGRLATSGLVDQGIVDRLLAHPFFSRHPPKSLDRNAWTADAVAGLGDADGAATLATFTVQSVARGMALLPAPARMLVVAGGGARNPVLVRGIAQRLNLPVRTAEELGWSGDALEAQAFAYLAVRSVRGLPLSFPGTTGVSAPLTGGVFVGV